MRNEKISAEKQYENQLNEMGCKLAHSLGMKIDCEHSDRWRTSFGTKTGLGLIRTLKHLIEEIERGNNPFDSKA